MSQEVCSLSILEANDSLTVALPNSSCKQISCEQTATMTTLQTVPTSFVAVDGLNVAYRRFGAHSSVPLVYVNHLRGGMDTLDPLLFNSIAKSREVIGQYRYRTQ